MNSCLLHGRHTRVATQSTSRKNARLEEMLPAFSLHLPCIPHWNPPAFPLHFPCILLCAPWNPLAFRLHASCMPPALPCQTPTRRRRLTHSLRVTTTARPMVSPKYSTAPPWSSPYRVLTSGAPTRPYWRTGRVCGPDRAIGLPAGSRPGHMGYRPGPDRAIWATGRA